MASALGMAQALLSLILLAAGQVQGDGFTRPLKVIRERAAVAAERRTGNLAGVT